MEKRVRNSVTIMKKLLVSTLIILSLTGEAIAVDEALWKALHDGGNVLLMRHATTEKKNDPLLFEPDNCILERDLSLEGKALVLDMGHALRQHAVPIGDVLSSRECKSSNTCSENFNLRPLGWVEITGRQGQDPSPWSLADQTSHSYFAGPDQKHL